MFSVSAADGEVPGTSYSVEAQGLPAAPGTEQAEPAPSGAPAASTPDGPATSASSSGSAPSGTSDPPNSSTTTTSTTSSTTTTSTTTTTTTTTTRMWWRESGYRAEVTGSTQNNGCQATYEADTYLYEDTDGAEDTIRFGFGERVFSAADLQSFPRG